MKTPFDTPAAAFVLDDQNKAVLAYYTSHRAAMFRMIGDEAQAARVLATTFDVADMTAFEDLARRMRHANADMRAWHEFTLAQVDEEVRRYRTAATAELTEGMYSADGDVFKVQRSKESGRLYAKVLQDGSFEYAPGAMRKLTVADRMSLDEAKAYGRRTGVCCVCGRQLTNPVSVAEGIGPICSGRF